MVRLRRKEEELMSIEVLGSKKKIFFLIARK